MGVLSTSPTTMDACINLCVKCERACEECTTACLKEQDLEARVKCLETLRDCADICMESVVFMSRQSQFNKGLCMLCADICDACAAECEQFNDKHCQECAQICRECSQACRDMAAKH